MQVGRLSALKRYDKVAALTFQANTPVPTASCPVASLVVAIDTLRAKVNSTNKQSVSPIKKSNHLLNLNYSDYL